MGDFVLFGYCACAFVFFMASSRWFPWEPDTIGTRMSGALIQSIIWPFSLLVWGWMMRFETRDDHE